MKRWTIHDATVFTPFERIDGASVHIEGDQIVSIGESPGWTGGEDLDASGLILVPGFIDLQINGAFGHDFTASPESIWDVGRELPRFGVTSFLPTIVTAPLDVLSQAQRTLLGGAPPGYRGAQPIGLHVEGPFLNPERKGAHRPEHLRSPNLSDCTNLSLEQGVRIVTLAPELPGALELVRALCRRGVVVSAGHSLATLEQARLAFTAGVRYATHLFNAMPPLHQFEPGLAGAVLADPGLRFGLIADGIHVHPTLVQLIWQLTGAGRLTLVSDAMAGLGQPPGRYRLGDHDEVIVNHRSARLPDGVLAGSILAQDAALRNLIAFTGCSLEEGLSCLTSTPADLLGLTGIYGQIAPGCRADFVLMDAGMQVRETFVSGQSVYCSVE